jgi:hypothetical protein
MIKFNFVAAMLVEKSKKKKRSPVLLNFEMNWLFNKPAVLHF